MITSKFSDHYQFWNKLLGEFKAVREEQIEWFLDEDLKLLTGLAQNYFELKSMKVSISGDGEIVFSLSEISEKDFLFFKLIQAMVQDKFYFKITIPKGRLFNVVDLAEADVVFFRLKYGHNEQTIDP